MPQLLGLADAAMRALTGGGRTRSYRRKRKYLLNPCVPATVRAIIQQSGNVNVERDGVITHLIVKGGDGLFRVRRFKGHGISRACKTPQEAAASYRLVVHQWKHA